jgi:Cu-Zn family superoxide dismutase
MSRAPGRAHPHFLVAIVSACLSIAACGGPEPAAPPAQQPAAPTDAQPMREQVTADGMLSAPERAQNAFTYNPAIAPEGARMAVQASQSDGSTEVRLEVSGLEPNRGYASHAHDRPCGPTGAAAGPHFQNNVDPAATPEQPSADPAFANPQNEIWLDLRTDDEGNGAASATVPFVFVDRAPASVVLHDAEATATAHGEAGTAGGRAACLNVPFDQMSG